MLPLQLLTLVALLTFALLPSSASTQTSCHLLTSANPVPRDFGAAYNLFSAARETVLRADCGSAQTAIVTVGNGRDNIYVYKTGFEWTGAEWRPFSFSGSQLAGDDWYLGQGFTTLQAVPGQDSWFVAYVCQPTGSVWKCGCKDFACRTAHWQLQGFNSSLPEVPPTSYPTTKPKKLFYPGAQFPSARSAPVNPPYFMYWSYALPNDPDEEGGLYRNTAIVYSKHANQKTWIDRWKANSPNTLILELRKPQAESPKDVWGIDRTDLDRYFSPAGRNEPRVQGWVFDEFSGVMENVEYQKIAAPAILKMKRENPSWFSVATSPHPWERGNHDWLVYDYHEAFDIFSPQAYLDQRGTCNYGARADETSDLDLWIDDAKNFGIEEKTSIILSTGDIKRTHKCDAPTPEFFDAQVEYVRDNLPQASISFYRNFLPGYTGNDAQYRSRFVEYGRIVKKHFFDPAPSVSLNLSNGQTLSGIRTVSATFTPNASTNEGIREYRFFIDNTVVYVGPSRSVNWNTARSGSGSHIVTVHAVDQDYLVGVAQASVTVQ